MKASELRVGNWVKHVKEDITEMWTAIDFSLFVSDAFFYMDNVKPVLITEEWLLKFGFTIDEEWSGYRLNYMRVTFILLPPGEESDVWSLYVEHDVACGFELVKYANIKAVHDIQNFFFAVVNEELTVK